MKRALLYEVDQSLLRRAKDIEGILSSSGVKTLEEVTTLRFEFKPLVRTSTPEVYVDLVSAQGETLWTSPNLGGRHIPIDLERALKTPGFATRVFEDGLKLRRYAEPYSLANGEIVLCVVAESLTNLDAALQASIGQSLILAIVIVTLTGLLGIWALKGAFAPLDRLIETAETIATTDDVTQRVPVLPEYDEELRRTSEAFNSLMDRVQQLLEVAKQLLADTSHELRNPLTVLSTDLDLLRKDLTPEERDEVVCEAQATVARMTRLVSDLLMLSRAETYPQEFVCHPEPAYPFLQKIGSRLQNVFDSSTTLIIHPWSKGSVPSALMHTERCEQILTNLIENAVRYSDGTDVELFLEQGDSSTISFVVKDKGCGISEEDQAKLFDRFFRVDPSRTPQSGGIGLGLPVARALARAQKGDITVVSAPGQGSEFRLHLRTAPPEA